MLRLRSPLYLSLCVPPPLAVPRFSYLLISLNLTHSSVHAQARWVPCGICTLHQPLRQVSRASTSVMHVEEIQRGIGYAGRAAPHGADVAAHKLLCSADHQSPQAQLFLVLLSSACLTGYSSQLALAYAGTPARCISRRQLGVGSSKWPQTPLGFMSGLARASAKSVDSSVARLPRICYIVGSMMRVAELLSGLRHRTGSYIAFLSRALQAGRLVLFCEHRTERCFAGAG